MHIGLIVISGAIGGTEKRFANLFNYLSWNSDHSYSLMLPVSLFGLLCEQGILQENQPGVIKLFKKKPASLYNALPWSICGFRIRGFSRILWPLWRREVVSYLRDFDVVHYALPTRFLRSTLSTKRAVVVEAQGSSLARLRQRFDKDAARRHAFFNCASERLQGEYSKVLTESAKQFFVSPCSFIDYTKTFVAPKERIVTFVGRLNAIKNPTMFVEVIDRVAQVRDDFKAYLLGTGKMERQIDKLIADRGLQHVLVRRFDSHPQGVLSHSLVFVSLQQYDNYHSQALMEAMACGCAVVASDVGETRKLVTDMEGFRVPLQVSAVADRVLFLLDNFDLAVKMGQTAREKVMNEHNISTYAEYLEDFYKHAYDYFYEADTERRRTTGT